MSKESSDIEGINANFKNLRYTFNVRTLRSPLKFLRFLHIEWNSRRFACLPEQKYENIKYLISLSYNRTHCVSSLQSNPCRVPAPRRSLFFTSRFIPHSRQREPKTLRFNYVLLLTSLLSMLCFWWQAGLKSFF